MHLPKKTDCNKVVLHAGDVGPRKHVPAKKKGHLFVVEVEAPSTRPQDGWQGSAVVVKEQFAVRREHKTSESNAKLCFRDQDGSAQSWSW